MQGNIVVRGVHKAVAEKEGVEFKLGPIFKTMENLRIENRTLILKA